MIKVCPVCGKEFKPVPRQRKYCSGECKYQAHLEQNRGWYRRHPEAYKKWREANRDKVNAYERKRKKNNYRKMKECRAAHDNCFACPTKDGECLYD